VQQGRRGVILSKLFSQGHKLCPTYTHASGRPVLLECRWPVVFTAVLPEPSGGREASGGKGRVPPACRVQPTTSPARANGACSRQATTPHTPSLSPECGRLSKSSRVKATQCVQALRLASGGFVLELCALQPRFGRQREEGRGGDDGAWGGIAFEGEGRIPIDAAFEWGGPGHPSIRGVVAAGCTCTSSCNLEEIPK
jgi:hypothetical protein